MRPGHIRVFDGLRITTDHIEHLQGSFHSGMEELRLAVWQGRVQDGFEVEATDDTHVTVQPGLAFDVAGNRIACEEPTVVEVTFPTGLGTRYLCLRHKQVEDAVVEGQATIVWDSCSVLLTDTRPLPEDNLVALAELRSWSEGSGFDVQRIALSGPSWREQAAFTDGIAVAQGVVRLDGAGDDPLASPAFREALRQWPAEDAGRRETRLVLAEREVAVGTLACSLSLQAVVTATVRCLAEAPANDPAPAEGPAAGAEAAGEAGPGQGEAAPGEGIPAAPLAVEPAWAALGLQARTTGEATVHGERVTQFGIAEVHYLSCPKEGGQASWCGAHLTEEGIAHLPLWAGRDRWSTGGDGAWDLIGGLQVLLKLERGAAPGSLRLRCELSWSGGGSAQPDEVIQRRRAQMDWGIVAAWKGLGQMVRPQDGGGGC